MRQKVGFMTSKHLELFNFGENLEQGIAHACVAFIMMVVEGLERLL